MSHPQTGIAIPNGAQLCYEVASTSQPLVMRHSHLYEITELVVQRIPNA